MAKSLNEIKKAIIRLQKKEKLSRRQYRQLQELVIAFKLLHVSSGNKSCVPPTMKTVSSRFCGVKETLKVKKVRKTRSKKAHEFSCCDGCPAAPKTNLERSIVNNPLLLNVISSVAERETRNQKETSNESEAN